VQDVLVKFVESFPRIVQSVPEYVCMSWMATTLHNAFISRLRKERVRQSMEPALVYEWPVAVDPASPAELQLFQLVTDGELMQAMSALSQKQREAFEASVQGKRHAEIARELGIREGAVAKRIFDARRRLKRRLLTRRGGSTKP